MAKCKLSSPNKLIFLKIRCRFFKYLRNVSIEGDTNKPNIEFTADGDLKSAELKIMNLRPNVNSKNLVWEEVSIDTKILSCICDSAT